MIDAVKSKLHILIALVLALCMVATSYSCVDAKETKKQEVKKDADKEASIYDLKTNAVTIQSSGYKKQENIVFSVYEKQEDGKYKLIKKSKLASAKKDLFYFTEILTENSTFDYGKTYKFKITGCNYDVKEESLAEIFAKRLSIKTATNPFSKDHKQKLLSDAEKSSIKNFGKVITINKKKTKIEKSFKIPTKNKRLWLFAKAFKTATYSQARRNEKGFADCSSFVHAVYKNIGMDLGGDGATTGVELKWCEKNALKVKIGCAKLGDLIFYTDPEDDSFKEHYKGCTHVAMFKNNNTIIEMSGAGVNFRERKVSQYDIDAIGVYRPIYDKSDLKDKSFAKQKLKKQKKKKKDKRKDKKKDIKKVSKTNKKQNKTTEYTKSPNPVVPEVETEEVTTIENETN